MVFLVHFNWTFRMSSWHCWMSMKWARDDRAHLYSVMLGSKLACCRYSELPVALYAGVFWTPPVGWKTTGWMKSHTLPADQPWQCCPSLVLSAWLLFRNWQRWINPSDVQYVKLHTLNLTCVIEDISFLFTEKKKTWSNISVFCFPLKTWVWGIWTGIRS